MSARPPAALFPALARGAVHRIWNGYVGMTRDFLPRHPSPGPRTPYAWAGCNGRAVACRSRSAANWRRRRAARIRRPYAPALQRPAPGALPCPGEAPGAAARAALLPPTGRARVGVTVVPIARPPSRAAAPARAPAAPRPRRRPPARGGTAPAAARWRAAAGPPRVARRGHGRRGSGRRRSPARCRGRVAAEPDDVGGEAVEAGEVVAVMPMWPYQAVSNGTSSACGNRRRSVRRAQPSWMPAPRPRSAPTLPTTRRPARSVRKELSTRRVSQAPSRRGSTEARALWPSGAVARLK